MMVFNSLLRVLLLLFGLLAVVAASSPVEARGMRQGMKLLSSRIDHIYHANLHLRY